ncbi:MAG: VIT1/CCC1 transporter family protein [Caulobacteraceae bacterium]|nr:VIT1/CCC1 transporter family protein [Caulobacteraceae bacterium]
MGTEEDVRRYRENLQGEVDGQALYQALAESEPDPKIAEVYRRLSSIEGAHAEFWRGRLAKLRPGARRPSPSLRARALGWLAHRFGAAFVLPTVGAAEARDSTAYDNQPDAVAAGLAADERSHRRIVEAVGEKVGGLPGPTIAALEGRHRGVAGNALRAAVLGANDGLVSNLSLVMGVAGALGGDRSVLVAGMAGLVAGACSMAMGEWLSVTSSRELHEKQIAGEAQELEHSPEEEREELVLIYEAKGVPTAQARALAERLLSNKETALDTLAREELGVDPNELGGSPWQAAGASFLLFALGAAFPVAPFFFLRGWPAIVAALLVAGAALAGIGAATSLFTGRSFAFSAVRQLVIGYAAAGITFAVGRLLGVAVS